MKRLSVLFLTLITTLNFAQAAVRISPTMIELDANKAKGNYLTTAFTVEGGKDETIRFKIYPEFFEITQDGKMESIPETNLPNSLVKGVRFVPSEFTLANGQAQKVRLTFTDINKLPEGESRMVLFLEDVVAKEVFLPTGDKSIVSKLVVKTRAGVPIYIDKGKYVKEGRFDDLKVEKRENDLIYTMQLSSLGNSKVRYNGVAQIIQDKNLIAEFPVNSNAVRAKGDFMEVSKLPLDKIEQNGEYTLRMVLNYQNEKKESKNLVKETNFKIENIAASKGEM